LGYVTSILGFYEVWLAQGVGNVNVFIRVFEQRLRDNNVQNWNSRVGKLPVNSYACVHLVVFCAYYW